MPRLLNISKYWVLRVEGAVAFALSKVYAILTPSMGLCAMPLTVVGALIPETSRIVGTMSIMWWNWVRIPPTSLMRAGHEIAMPCCVPPKCEAICLVHLNGASNVQAHATAMCGYVLAEPQASYCFSCSATGNSRMPLYDVYWLGVPSTVPSGLVPLSPTMYLINVLSSLPI